MNQAIATPRSASCEMFIDTPFHEYPAPPERPPLTAFEFNYEIAAADQVLYGERPATAFAVITREGRRQPADPSAAPAKLNELAAALNAFAADADLTDAERHFLVVVIADPAGGFDDEGKLFFRSRRIEARFSGNRRPLSRRYLARNAPTLHAFLDTANGTAGDPLPQSDDEREAADQAARDAAAASELQAAQELQDAADRAQHELLMQDVEAAIDPTMPPRRRASLLLKTVAALISQPRLAALSLSEST